MRAYILITTKPGTSEEVVSTIINAKNLKNVKLADSVYGRFDAVIVVEVESLDELAKLTYEIIEKIPNIIHTETLISLS
ncbi:MAG: Lrp/AsnC ligand binding domain-containing protein [Candidatus Bathyarchaeota archaeon]|nr:Lrp/AsnC ligand binding domain-containing protein [Candidatus Bathyarchaeota archaeon]